MIRNVGCTHTSHHYNLPWFVSDNAKCNPYLHAIECDQMRVWFDAENNKFSSLTWVFQRKIPAISPEAYKNSYDAYGYDKNGLSRKITALPLALYRLASATVFIATGALFFGAGLTLCLLVQAIQFLCGLPSNFSTWIHVITVLLSSAIIDLQLAKELIALPFSKDELKRMQEIHRLLLEQVAVMNTFNITKSYSELLGDNLDSLFDLKIAEFLGTNSDSPIYQFSITLSEKFKGWEDNDNITVDHIIDAVESRFKREVCEKIPLKQLNNIKEVCFLSLMNYLTESKVRSPKVVLLILKCFFHISNNSILDWYDQLEKEALLNQGSENDKLNIVSDYIFENFTEEEVKKLIHFAKAIYKQKNQFAISVNSTEKIKLLIPKLIEKQPLLAFDEKRKKEFFSFVWVYKCLRSKNQSLYSNDSRNVMLAYLFKKSLSEEFPGIELGEVNNSFINNIKSKTFSSNTN